MTNEVQFQWGRDFEFQSSQASASRRAGVARPAARRPWTSRARAASASASRTSSSAGPIRTSAGSTSATWSRWWGGSHLVKFGGDVSRVSDTLDNLFQEGGVYAYGSRVDFISDYEANVRNAAAPSRNYTSFSQGVGPTAFSFRTFDFDAFVQDTWHVNLAHDAQSRPALRLREDAGAADSELLAAGHLGVPEGPEQLRTAHSASPTIVSGDRQHGRPRRLRHVLRPHHQLDDLERHHQRRIGRRPAGAGAAEHVGRRADLPEHPRERLGDAGAAGRRRVRGQRAEPAGARVRPDLRASHRGEHAGVGVLRRQRGPQPAAVHRHQPAGRPRAR